MEFKEIVEQLTAFDDKLLRTCIGNIFTQAPKHAVRFIAKLVDIEPEVLLNDENIGLDGLVAIINAFIEINELGKFMAGFAKIRLKLRGNKETTTPGFKDLLRQD